MNRDDTSGVTRRAALAGLGGLAALVTSESAATAVEQPVQGKRQRMADVEKEYRRLLPLWQKERNELPRALSAHTKKYWDGPYGKAIIALGPAIIPFLIQEIRKGDFFFNVPLALLTNVEQEPENVASISEQERAQLWLKWWDRGCEGVK